MRDQADRMIDAMAREYRSGIEWDKDTFEVSENDIAGSGTRCGKVCGYINTGAGEGQGVEEYEAKASSIFPYDEIEIDEDTAEFAGFSPNEPEGV